MWIDFQCRINTPDCFSIKFFANYHLSFFSSNFSNIVMNLWRSNEETNSFKSFSSRECHDFIHWKRIRFKLFQVLKGAKIVTLLLGVKGKFLVSHKFKTQKWWCGIPLLIKLSLHHKQDDSEQTRPSSRCHLS